ncbi:MAG TPA: T9SS type A sorting domain-containing protein [Bacteroidales bacterium]|nr:T9SS type A sorting domain-containing protein [Bacteroidales bacterium]
MISSVMIYDLNGIIIRNINSLGNSFTIDMESFDPGFYIVVAIFSDKTKSVKRIVKQ